MAHVTCTRIVTLQNTLDFYDYIPNNIWLSVAYTSKLLQNYDLLQITIKKNDSKFTIYGIGGIISDIDMPIMSGLEMAKVILKDNPKQVIILLCENKSFSCKTIYI